MKKMTLFSLFLMGYQLVHPSSYASNRDSSDDIIDVIDEWLDPGLKSYKKEVVQIMRHLTKEL